MDAVYLAELMVETGRRMGKKMVALITDMEQPLGRKVGNALEVEECIEVLARRRAGRFARAMFGFVGVDADARREMRKGFAMGAKSRRK